MLAVGAVVSQVLVAGLLGFNPVQNVENQIQNKPMGLPNTCSTGNLDQLRKLSWASFGLMMFVVAGSQLFLLFANGVRALGREAHITANRLGVKDDFMNEASIELGGQTTRGNLRRF
jgi:hypothetical protein